MTRSAVLAVGLCACVVPSDEVVEDRPTGDVALYRVEDGDSLSAIADALSLPGGWRALARFNGLEENVRAGSGLRIPVGYIRNAGLDPVHDFGLEPFTPPEAPAPLVPCVTQASRGACVEAGDRVLCLEGEDEGRAVVLYRGGVRVQTIALPDEVMPGMYEEDRRELLLDRVDLDADRREELVVAVPVEITSRMGFERATVLVLDERDRVTRLNVEQWGTGSLVEGEAGRCDLLATTWSYVRHPLDGEGMYFVGRRMTYEDGELVPQAGAVVRRMSTYFHLAAEGAVATPAAWLEGSPRWHELGTSLPVVGTSRGVIADVRATELGLELFVKLASGADVMLSHDVDSGMCGSWRTPYSALVSAPTGTWYPERYVPAEPQRLVGAEVMIEERSVEEDTSCEPDEYPWLERLVYVAPR